MNYLGLDCSTLAVHGVLVASDESIVKQYKWSSKKKTFEARFPEILLGFSGELSRINIIDKAAVEAAIFVQNPKTTIAIAHVVGAVWFSLLKRGMIESVRVDNKHWKKEIVGKGNASKKDIKDYAIDKWGDIFPEQDFADAACIALWNKRSED
tara:strand:+ start:3818 stop:4276 length:459 start_codon:yes stop_codon:yes gene_type:complete